MAVFFEKFLPCLAMSCSTLLLIIGIIQARIYFNKGYERSKTLMIFSFFSVAECLNHYVAQSRIFPYEVTYFVTHLGVLSTFGLALYYMKSLNYFIAVPNWLSKVYTNTFRALIGFTSFVFAYWLFTGEGLYFDNSNLLATGNYFVDTYQTRFGVPTPFVTFPLGIGGVMTLIGASVMLYSVLKSTRDIYFTIGLILTILCVIRESLLLPLTVTYYVPVIFLANLFESFRMTSLSYNEYVADTLEEKKQHLENGKEKYQNSSLSDERLKGLADELIEALQGQRLFLNSQLSSEDLAKKLDIPSYQLSQVINIGLKTSFFDLINWYRIEEVKKKLKDVDFDHETILNIAYDSGFNSKSAFNSAFKKITGMTPSAFRKK